MKQLFLSLLSDARLNQKSEPCECNFEELFTLATEHQVVALIYSQIYNFPNFPVELKNNWKRESLKINMFQTMRTNRFLKLYQQLLDEGLKVIVVKGLICRNLYPQPELRDSNDEDMYVRKEDYQKTYDIFVKNGLQVVSEETDVTTFIDMSCGLSIELHTELFSKESKAYGNYQDIFVDAFEDATIHNIQGVNVYSLSYDKHLLFLILHFVKHFLHGGVGIRQVLDIIMYSEVYLKEIHWNGIYVELDKLNTFTLIANVYAMAEKYLGFDISKIHLPNQILQSIDFNELLDDILDAGIFGQSTQERIHSSTITLNSMETGKTSILRSVFPTAKEMKAKFNYLSTKPYLLPFAYIHRMWNYIINNHNKESMKTIEIGKQRVDLLKKYKIIK